MHLQAIVTKYHGPTNTRGSRISAKASAGRVTVGYDCGLSTTANHAAAAKALAEKMGWGGHWVSGGMPEGMGDVFVCVAANRRAPLGARPNGQNLLVETAFSTVLAEG